MSESLTSTGLPPHPVTPSGRLLFDYDANHYEVSGDALNKDSLAYLDEIRRTLKKYDVSFPGLYLKGKEIRAIHGGETYVLGDVHTQGANEQRIIYPCFRDEFVFDFATRAPSFSLWNALDEELRTSYTALRSGIIKDGGAEEHWVNFVLTQDFTALVNPGGENFKAEKQELDFLRGLLALYQVGVAQARMRAFHGVVLTSPGVSATKHRRKRAVENSLNLLVGDDIADIKLYQLIASHRRGVSAQMQLLSKYYTQWKGRINTHRDFSGFLSAINLVAVYPELLVGLQQLSQLKEYGITRALLSLPNEGSPAWREMVVRIHDEFSVLRRKILDRLLGHGDSYYLELGADYTISNKKLQVQYAAGAAAGNLFNGVVNVIGHGEHIESLVARDAEKIAHWLYNNIMGVYGSSGFGKLKVVSFQSCHIARRLADYITLLLLQKALPHFEKDKIPNVLVVSSPRASLVLTANPPLGRLPNLWQQHHLIFPGIVLKAFRHLVNTHPNIQLAIGEHFDEAGQRPDLSDRPFVEYLRRQHVLAASRLHLRDVSHMGEVTLDYLKGVTASAVGSRQAELNGCFRVIQDKFPEMIGEIRSLLAIASIAQASQLLPVGDAGTARKVVDFLVRLKTARDQRDFTGGYKAYTETKIKFLIDPYDPAGTVKIRRITDVIFKLCGSPVPSSGLNYQSAYEKLFRLDKQEYFEMTGIHIDSAAREFFKNIPYVEFTALEFGRFQAPTPQSNTIIVDTALRQALLGSEQLGVSTRELRALLESGDDTRTLPAMDRLESSLNRKKSLLNGSRSLRTLQETQENLARAKTHLEKKQLSPVALKTTARLAAGSSRLLGAFGVFVDFRTQPFHLDFSSVKSGLLTSSDSLAVIKGVFDFTADVGAALALRLASSASRALWQPRLDQLFFKLNKVLLPLDVLFTAVSLYRNVEGARLAQTLEEQALYLTMTVIDAASFGVGLAGFILIGVPGVGVALILVGMALAVVNILLNAIVSLSQLDNYRWDEKAGLFFGNLFGSATLHGILTQQQMRQAADQLFTGLLEEGIDLLLTPMINDADDHDRTNRLKAIGAPSQGSSVRGYTLSPLGLGPNDLDARPDAVGREKSEQVHRGWYLRRHAARRGVERKLMVTMPSTPNTRLEVLDFGAVPTILLFGATPHLLLDANPFGWAMGESPQERALNKYQVRLHPGTPYTLQFKKSVLTSRDFDSNFGSRTELVVPQEAFQRLPQVSLDLSGQDRETLEELDLSRSSLEVIKFKGKSTFRLDLVSADGEAACALEQVVRTVQLPAHVRFKSGETYPVMAVVGENSHITLRNSTGQSLLLLKRDVSRCDIDLHASVRGFAVSV